MAEDLMELIPELGLIKGQDLRKRVISVWDEAMEIGGWTINDLRQIPYTLLVKSVDVSFIEHVRTVCRLCIAMENVLQEAYGDRYGIDKDILIAGALLADVGKLIEISKAANGFSKIPEPATTPNAIVPQ